MSKHISIFAVSVFAVFGLCGHALAHAHLITSIPADKAKVTISPVELDLHFSEELNIKFSGAKISGDDGTPIKAGEASLSDAGKTLTVPITTALGAGAYTVEWQVLSTDGHKTHGSFSFTVKP